MHTEYEILKIRACSLIGFPHFLDFQKFPGQTWGSHRNPPSFPMLQKTKSAEQQGHSEAAWRHAQRLQAPSEHLIEFRHDKIPAIFPAFFSHPLGAQQGFVCLFGLREIRGEGQGMQRAQKERVKVGRGALRGDKRR